MVLTVFRRLPTRVQCLSVVSYSSMGRPVLPLSTASNTIQRRLQRQTPFKVSTKSGIATLPKLPVPNLQTTISKFLTLAKPIVTQDEFRKTAVLAEKFLVSDEAEEFQAVIRERAQTRLNWLAEWWDTAAYLDGRTPLPIVTSPGVIFPQFNFAGIEGQIDVASKLIIGSLHYLDDIENGRLEQDKAGKDYFDMSQYGRLFGTTRIPQKGRDKLRCGKDETTRATHILVAKNAHFFTMPVYDEDGHVLSLNQLKELLKQVMQDAQQANPRPISIASSDDRDIWANVYTRLKENKKNADNLEAIEKALFVVCLDESWPSSYDGEPVDEQARQALHGGGIASNSNNRWFDKTLQFVVGLRGDVGLCYEHTPADGPPVANLMDSLCTLIEKNDFGKQDKGAKTSRPAQRLDFELTAADDQAIKAAGHRFDSATKDVEVRSYSFMHFGKNLPKSQRISPDSFIQMAFQLTFYRLHETHPPTYETGSLRKYAEGRTDTIRLPNPESAAFVETAFRHESPPILVDVQQKAPVGKESQSLADLLRKAANAHKQYSVDAMNGRAIDRHLLGLKLAALSKGKTPPHFLNDVAYQRMVHFRLSTSQVPTKHFIPMCFGPSASDCYGICYNPQETVLHFTITAFYSCPQTSALRFSQELEKTLLDMEKMLAEGAKPKAKL